MVSVTRQIARGQWDSSAITESAQAEVRPLGSLEHLFWLLDQHHFVHFAVTALISGETSPRDWRRALDRLQKRHPILSVCVDGEPDSVPSFRQADVTPILLRIVEDEPELRWEVEVGKELARPFNPSRAPLIRAVLIQGAREAAFMLVAHHSIADGLSLAYAIRDTLDALAAHVCRPAFGEARNERHLLRLGREGGAIPYPARDSQPEQRPAWVQQADGLRQVGCWPCHGHQGAGHEPFTPTTRGNRPGDPKNVGPGELSNRFGRSGRMRTGCPERDEGEAGQ